MEKKGQINWGGVATTALGIAGAMALATFADSIIDALKESNLKSKSKEYYQEMLKAHPALKKQDPKVVAQYWASLFHFAPHMAADPLSAGAFIRQSIDRGFPDLYGGPPVDTYSTLAGIQKAVTDSKQSKNRFSEAATSAAGKVMGTSLEDVAGY